MNERTNELIQEAGRFHFGPSMCVPWDSREERASETLFQHLCVSLPP